MITRIPRPGTVGMPARNRSWLAVAILALLFSTIESTSAAGQQPSSVVAIAQVVPMSMPVTPQVVSTLLHDLSNHAVAQGSWHTGASSPSRSVAMDSGLSTMEARTECVGESEACELLVTVQFIGD